MGYGSANGIRVSYFLMRNHIQLKFQDSSFQGSKVTVGTKSAAKSNMPLQLVEVGNIIILKGSKITFLIPVCTSITAVNIVSINESNRSVPHTCQHVKK